MIHYHGTPIWPSTAAYSALKGGHAFVSFARPDQLMIAVDVAQSFAVDNGAFSAWKAGEPVRCWKRYYDWVAHLHRFPSFDFAVIPDVIDGTESDNDALIEAWPWQSKSSSWVGAPVWHMHESIDRLVRLCREWPRVCVGSSGSFSAVGNSKWWSRMGEAMNAICDREGLPICKIHGLRMLNQDVFTRLPLASADSTNIAKNIGIDQSWKGTYRPTSKDVRSIVLRDRIESAQSLSFWNRQPIQTSMDIE